MRFIYLLTTLGLGAILSGCVTPPKKVSGDAPIRGLLNTASDASDLSVFLIHGMGETSRCFYMSSAQMLAMNESLDPCDPRFGTNAQTDVFPVKLSTSYTYQWPDPSRITDPVDVQTFGMLHRTRIPKEGGSNRPNIVQYAYYWHEDAWDVQLKAIGCDFPASSPYRPIVGCRSDAPKRAWLNSTIKTSILNEGISDAALYAGEFGKIIRAGTRDAYCFMILDSLSSPNSFDETDAACTQLTNKLSQAGVTIDTADPLRQLSTPGQSLSINFSVLTRSLGSRIFFDAMAETANGTVDLADKARLSTLLKYTPDIYMSANQLPLLALSQIMVEPTADFDVLVSESDAMGQMDGNDLLRLYLGGSDTELAGPFETIETTEHDSLDGNIIAFSDPNDALGYRIGDILPDEFVPNYADIEQLEARVWFGLFAWFPDAHDQSFDSKEARQIVMCGAELKEHDKTLEPNSCDD